MTARRGKWVQEEDSKLKVAVQTHGGKNWGAIATLVPGRTNDQCRQRCKNVLAPSINTGGPILSSISLISRVTLARQDVRHTAFKAALYYYYYYHTNTTSGINDRRLKRKAIDER